MRTPGQLFLQPVLFVAAVFMIATFAANLVFSARSAITPAVVFYNVEIATKSVATGDKLIVSYDYDKRADCYPPKGSGDFYYRVYVEDSDGQFRHFYRIDAGNAALEPPGVGLHAENTVLLPRTLLPGKYGLQIRGIFQCRGEQHPQALEPRMLLFTVEPS